MSPASDGPLSASLAAAPEADEARAAASPAPAAEADGAGGFAVTSCVDGRVHVPRLNAKTLHETKPK
jgi:hypothetical protein